MIYHSSIETKNPQVRKCKLDGQVCAPVHGEELKGHLQIAYVQSECVFQSLLLSVCRSSKGRHLARVQAVSLCGSNALIPNPYPDSKSLP